MSTGSMVSTAAGKPAVSRQNPASLPLSLAVGASAAAGSATPAVLTIGNSTNQAGTVPNNAVTTGATSGFLSGPQATKANAANEDVKGAAAVQQEGNANKNGSPVPPLPPWSGPKFDTSSRSLA